MKKILLSSALLAAFVGFLSFGKAQAAPAGYYEGSFSGLWLLNQNNPSFQHPPINIPAINGQITAGVFNNGTVDFNRLSGNIQSFVNSQASSHMDYFNGYWQGPR